MRGKMLLKRENGDQGDERDQTSINWPLNQCEAASFSAHCPAQPRFLIKGGGMWPSPFCPCCFRHGEAEFPTEPSNELMLYSCWRKGDATRQKLQLRWASHTDLGEYKHTCTHILQHICSIFHKMEMYEKGFEGKSATSFPQFPHACTKSLKIMYRNSQRWKQIHQYIDLLIYNSLQRWINYTVLSKMTASLVSAGSQSADWTFKKLSVSP